MVRYMIVTNCINHKTATKKKETTNTLPFPIHPVATRFSLFAQGRFSKRKNKKEKNVKKIIIIKNK